MAVDQMRMRELYTTARYDNRPAIEDILEVANRIEAFVEARGGDLRVKGVELVRVILHYVTYRHRMQYTQIQCRRRVRRPADWLLVHEQNWRLWVEDTFPVEEWMEEVMYPVFGLDTRSWEAMIPSWREELVSFLPYWMDRSFAPIEEPLDSETEDE